MNEKFENIGLKELTEIENLTARTYNICKYNQLLDLEQILLFYYKNGDFKKHLRNCGAKSNKELISICNKYELSYIQSPILPLDNKGGKTALSHIVSSITITQESIVNGLLFVKFNNLTARCINALNIYLQNDISIRNLNKRIFSNPDYTIIALKNIGYMSGYEINVFLNESKEILRLISGIKDENELKKETLKALLSKHFLVDAKILKGIDNYDFSDGIPIFKTIHFLIKQNYIFNHDEKIIFNHSLGFFLDRIPESHNESSKRIGLTRERVRQIRKKIFDRFNYYFSFIVSFEREKLNVYNLDTSLNFHNIGQSFLDKLLKSESVQFNVIFINRIFSILFSDIYSLIGNDNKIVLGNSHRDIHNWKTTYLISNHICSAFDFEKMANDVSLRLSERIKKGYNFNFQTYLLNFQRKNYHENLDDISQISRQILYNEFGIKINVNIVFKRNTRKFIPEHIYDVLKQSGKPLNIYEIHDILNQQFPGISKRTEALRGSCQRDPHIITLGSNTYGLKSWEKKYENIKGGTIHDIAEEYLLKYDLPKHIDDINKYVNKYRENILSKNLLANLKLSRQERFLFFKDRFVGLASKTYKNNIYTKLPKYHSIKRPWEESYNLLVEFTNKYKHLPKYSGKDYERKLYRFLIDQRRKLDELDETKKELLQELLSKYYLKQRRGYKYK